MADRSATDCERVLQNDNIQKGQIEEKLISEG